MLRESKIWLATSNSHKLMEARDVLVKYGIRLEHMPVERVEIQADDPAEIATHSLRQIPDEDRSVAVEDAGLFIDHYGGFPGPYSSYILETLDLPGILKLMEGLENREASYNSFVALRHKGQIRLFRGTVKGRIAHSIRGTHGFGYDPIFVPDEGDGRTFGETSNEEKNAISHRARAFRSLGAWLLGSEEDF